MKKSLIALAVAGTFAAPAFAATENVDVYGKLHVSLNIPGDQADIGNGSGDLQLASNASRFGIKGAEDLGGGLSAIWQFEQTLNLDESGGALATRNSFLGLKGGFGTVLAGRHDTPLKLVGRAVDLFGDTMADSRNVLNGGSDTRANNVIAYLTPNMGGFGIAAAYVTDLGAGEVADSSLYNLNATYKNGPVYVGLGYGDGDGHENLGLGAHMRLAGGFDMGSFKLVAQYDSLEDDSHFQGQAGDFTGFMVGGAFTMGNVVLKANYMEGEYDGDINAVNVVGGVVVAAPQASRDVEQFTIGVDYNLSKRTTVYALYAAGEGIILGSGAGSTDPISSCGTCGGDISVVSLGMTHTF
jgi:predicted porin